MNTEMHTEMHTDTECPICRESLGKDGRAILSCGHEYCVSCLVKWGRRSSTCPKCRRNFESNTSTNKDAIWAFVSERHIPGYFQQLYRNINNQDESTAAKILCRAVRDNVYIACDGF